MKPFIQLVFLAMTLFTPFLVGCQKGTPDKPKVSEAPAKEAAKGDKKAEIQANLAKLGPEDRKLAEAQGYCAVETENPLGSMGVPYKIEIQGQPVFLCCDACETRAKAHADRTLDRVKKLKEKRAETPGQ